MDAFYHRRALGLFFFDGTQGPWFWTFSAVTVFSRTRIRQFRLQYPYTCRFHGWRCEPFVYRYWPAGALGIREHVGLFFQDALQATRKLSLNYGLRYDYFGPLHDPHTDLSTFLPSKGGLVLQAQA